MKTFSIVCVYNNKEILRKYLLKSLKKQTESYELILIDNTNKQFSSVAEGLNAGGKKAKGKYIMFVHQDVDLISETWLMKAKKLLDKLPKLGIAGVAGKNSIKGIFTNIKHGTPPHPAGEIHLENPIEVQTLDECLIIIPKSVFQYLKFDEKTCSDWHLYAVDYSLDVQKRGLKAYVIPLPIYHRSIGQLSEGYFMTLRKILKKHKDFKWVHTTMGDWYTRAPVALQRKTPLVRGLEVLEEEGVRIFLKKFLLFIARHLRTLKEL